MNIVAMSHARQQIDKWFHKNDLVNYVWMKITRRLSFFFTIMNVSQTSISKIMFTFKMRFFWKSKLTQPYLIILRKNVHKQLFKSLCFCLFSTILLLLYIYYCKFGTQIIYANSYQYYNNQNFIYIFKMAAVTITIYWMY